MSGYRVFDFYKKAPPPPPPLRVWAKNPGEPAQCFESTVRDIPQAIGLAKREGFKRAFVEVK
jgi:hypothetical protein